MKKIFTVLILICMCIVTGCSSSSTDEVVGTINRTLNTTDYKNGKWESKITFTYKEKKLTEIKQEISLKVKTNAEFTKAKKSAKDTNFGDDYKGVTYKVESDKEEKKVTISMDVDLSKYNATKDELSLFVSIKKKDYTEKKAVKKLKSDGYTVKLNGKKQ